MGIVIKQSIKTSLITYSGFLLGYILTLYLFPLILTPAQVGTARLLINLAMVFSTFATLGAGQICSRFYFQFKDQTINRDGFLSFIVILGSIGSILFILIYIILFETLKTSYLQHSKIFVQYLVFIIPLTIVFVYSSILESFSIINQRPVIPSLIREIVVRIIIIVSVCGIAFHIIDFNGFMILYIAAYSIAPFLLIYYLIKEKIFTRTISFAVFRHADFPKILLFGLFIVTANIGGAVAANIDSIMISSQKGLAATGVYTIAFFIAAIVDVPKRSISAAIIPAIAEANNVDDRVQLEKIYKKSSINQAIVGGIIFMSIWLSLDSIFSIMPNGVEYQGGKWVVFYLGMAKLFDMFTGVNAEIIYTSRYYKADLLIYSVIALAGGIILNYYFIAIYGMIGAAIATAIIVLTFNTARFIFVYLVLKIHPFSINTIGAVLLVIAAFILDSILPTLSLPILNIVFRVFIVIVLFLVPTIYFHLSDEIYVTVKSLWLRIKY
jgi:O-antigen/teichoic acid export membrane protein